MTGEVEVTLEALPVVAAAAAEFVAVAAELFAVAAAVEQVT